MSTKAGILTVVALACALQSNATCDGTGSCGIGLDQTSLLQRRTVIELGLGRKANTNESSLSTKAKACSADKFSPDDVLNHYVVACSHNTYLQNDQYLWNAREKPGAYEETTIIEGEADTHSNVHEGAVLAALTEGFRMVELDVYDKGDQIIVGHCTTTKTPLYPLVCPTGYKPLEGFLQAIANWMHFDEEFQTEQRRVDPVLGDLAVTFKEMMDKHEAFGNNYDTVDAFNKLNDYWDSLKVYTSPEEAMGRAPLILSIENHIENRGVNNQMTELFIKHFGDRIWTGPAVPTFKEVLGSQRKVILSDGHTRYMDATPEWRALNKIWPIKEPIIRAGDRECCPSDLPDDDRCLLNANENDLLGTAHAEDLQKASDWAKTSGYVRVYPTGVGSHASRMVSGNLDWRPFVKKGLQFVCLNRQSIDDSVTSFKAWMKEMEDMGIAFDGFIPQESAELCTP